MNIKEKYKLALVECKDKFAIQNVHQLPSLKKMTLCFNLGNQGTDKKFLQNVKNDMVLLTGSKPIVRNAKFSDAALKIREGQPLSVICTLRGKKMFHMLDKLVYIALPRLRDFRGLNKNFDRDGNFTITLPGDSSIFYEVNFLVDLNICCRISSSSKEKSLLLLSKINLPFSL